MSCTSYIALESHLSLSLSFLTYKWKITVSIVSQMTQVKRKGKFNSKLLSNTGDIVSHNWKKKKKSRDRTSGIVWSGVWLYSSAIISALVPSLCCVLALSLDWLLSCSKMPVCCSFPIIRKSQLGSDYLWWRDHCWTNPCGTWSIFSPLWRRVKYSSNHLLPGRDEMMLGGQLPC